MMSGLWLLMNNEQLHEDSVKNNFKNKAYFTSNM